MYTCKVEAGRAVTSIIVLEIHANYSRLGVIIYLLLMLAISNYSLIEHVHLFLSH